MPDDDERFESRVRAHLARIDAMPARAGLSERVRIHIDTRRRVPALTTTLGLVAAIALVVILILVLTTGQQSSNVFTNISNGLSQ